ncbi:DUF190 domain-containing protein [Streptomyces sp. NPDC001262]|uniref:DUF190 domain-containing protein n=1 Tax=Streptomyces TaxID=1883 RepID=UPI0036BEBBEB
MHRLTVFVRTTDTAGHSPLYVEIVRHARQHGLRGATVLPCVAGFGETRILRRRRGLRLAQDRPLMLLFVDTADRIALFRMSLREIAPGSLAVLDVVTTA